MMKFKSINFTLILCALLTGCSTILKDQSAEADLVKPVLQELATAEIEIIPELAPTPEIVEQKDAPVPQLRDPRFDLVAMNVNAKSFFMGLMKESESNLVIHPKVKGRISLQVKQVTVPEVLGMTREMYGYGFRAVPGGYMVYPAELMTRVFKVDYLDVKRTGHSRTRISSGQVTDANSEGAGETGSGSEESSGTSFGSRIETITDADFWSQLDKGLSTMLAKRPGRSVAITPQAGVLVVKAMPDELLQVEEYLNAIEGTLHRQVILEAKIMEVELFDRFESGVNWSALGRPSENKSIFASQLSGVDTAITGKSTLAGNAFNLGDVSALSNIPALGSGGVFGLAMNLNDFDVFVELLAQQGNVSVLSSPRVSTINNQKAVIKVGTDEFFVTGVTSNTTAGTATTTNRNIELTPFFSGIALDVTPQIDARGMVTLHIHPTISEVQDQVKSFTVQGLNETLPLAVSNIRESDSIVRAMSGQVVVIGGLMQNKSEGRDASVPGLGRIPLVGHLFKHELKDTRKRELVILLRPVVVGVTPQERSGGIMAGHNWVGLTP